MIICSCNKFYVDMFAFGKLDIWPDGHSICGPIVPLDMCHNVARIGQKHIESSTVIKSYGIVQFSSNTNGRVQGL